MMPTATFSMRMDAEVKRRLEEEAARADRSAAWVAQRAIEDFLGRQDALREAVREAIENDDGTRISGEVVMNWMARWADGHDEPFPEADIFLSPEELKKFA